MKEIWVAIVTDIDDGQLIVNGVFNNEKSANECVQNDFLAANSLVYRFDLSNVKESYEPSLDE